MKKLAEIEKALINKLKMKHLSLLVEIDRHENVLKASRQLNMTQPAASKMLQEIEEILETTLFDRGPRGVSTTSTGQILVARAKQILGDLRQASEEIAGYEEGITGHVKIGTLLAAAPALLPNAVALLKSTHPQIVVSINDDINEALLKAVEEGDIDLAITRMQSYVLQKNLVHETLYQDRMCVVSRVDHPMTAQRNISLHELAECHWILPGSQTMLRDMFDELFSKAGVKPPSNKVVESVSLHMNLSLMLNTEMVTFLPYHAVKPYISLGLLSELDTEISSVYGPIGVTYRDYEGLSSAARIMLDCLRSESEKLA